MLRNCLIKIPVFVRHISAMLGLGNISCLLMSAIKVAYSDLMHCTIYYGKRTYHLKKKKKSGNLQRPLTPITYSCHIINHIWFCDYAEI